MFDGVCVCSWGSCESVCVCVCSKVCVRVRVRVNSCVCVCMFKGQCACACSSTSVCVRGGFVCHITTGTHTHKHFTRKFRTCTYFSEVDIGMNGDEDHRIEDIAVQEVWKDTRAAGAQARVRFGTRTRRETNPAKRQRCV